MRKDQTYRETKMLLVQKLAGMNLLRDIFDELDDDVHKIKKREWFRGIHRYSSKNDIVKDFMVGTPISCFASKTDKDTFHVAYFGQVWSVVNLLTFKQRITTMPAQESGMHFCKFVLEKKEESNSAYIRHVQKDELGELVGDPALLLPYKKEGCTFKNQYTATYSDWHVSRSDPTEHKGLPEADMDVFTDDLLESLNSMAL